MVWERNICQYSVANDVAKSPKMTENAAYRDDPETVTISEVVRRGHKQGKEERLGHSRSTRLTIVTVQGALYSTLGRYRSNWRHPKY